LIFFKCVEKVIEAYLRTHTDLPDHVVDVTSVQYDIWLVYIKLSQYMSEWRDEIDLAFQLTTDQIKDGAANIWGTDALPSVQYPVPYIFDPDIAAAGKTTGDISAIRQADPFDVSANLTFAGDKEQDLAENGTRSASSQLNKCLDRRLHELTGRPLPNMANWRVHSFEFIRRVPGGQEALGNPERNFNGLRFDDDGSLLPGNLTEGAIGRTARWLMVTSYEEPSYLQDLIFRVHESSSPYSKVATDVYRDDHPCGEAATNSDVFLFAFSIALVSTYAHSYWGPHVHLIKHRSRCPNLFHLFDIRLRLELVSLNERSLW